MMSTKHHHRSCGVWNLENLILYNINYIVVVSTKGGGERGKGGRE